MTEFSTYTERQGCIGITVGCRKIIDVDCVSSGNTVISIVPMKSNTSIACGLVCGTNLGHEVLLSSDAYLLTLNSKYLIVEKQQ